MILSLAMFYQRNIFKVNIFYPETISRGGGGELLNEFIFEDGVSCKKLQEVNNE